MMPVSSHGPEPIIVEIEGVGELEFPGDTDPAVIQAKVKELTTPKGAPGEFAQYGPLSQLMRDQAYPEQARANFKEAAPVIGAGLSVAAGPGGVIPSALLAGGGGFLGARARGDSRSDASAEGVKQAVLETAIGVPLRIVRALAPPIYRAAIPKHIQDKFGDLAKQGLSARVLLGTKTGTKTAMREGNVAAQEIQAAAPSVSPMRASDVQEAFTPKYNKALTGGKVDRANEINAHVKKSMEEIGPGEFTGRQQLARKEFLEQEGKSAMTAANSNMAAVNPQLANIERKAITKNLHVSPEMSRALQRSQGAIGLTRAAKATENSSFLNRLDGPSTFKALKSPMGLSGTAIGINELSNIPFAQLVRMAQLAALKDHP